MLPYGGKMTIIYATDTFYYGSFNIINKINELLDPDQSCYMPLL